MPIRPLHDRILIQRVSEEEKTSAGIIIPDTAKEKPIEGKVIAVGPGSAKKDGSRQPLEVKPGDHVLFGKYSGTEITVGGEEQLVLKEDDVLAVIER
ncbi:MAG: co-chaperone GroES [Proteobacteria bacterium]|nr:co-chaperone GroES [Pseudomonadota bacterium]